MFSEIQTIKQSLEKECVTELLVKAFGRPLELDTLDHGYQQNRRKNYTEGDDGFFQYFWDEAEWDFIFRNKQKIIDFYDAFLWYCLDYAPSGDIINISGY